MDYPKEIGGLRWRKTSSLKPINVGEANARKERGEEEEEELLSPAARLFHEPNFNVYIIAILGCKTRIDPDLAEAVGVFRIHHSLGDGVSLTSLLLACTRQIADPDALPTIPTPRKKKEEGLLAGFWRAVVAVWTAAVLMWNTAVDVAAFLLTAIWVEDTKTPLKGPHGVEFLPRRFVWKSMSLDDFKLVKNAMNAKSLMYVNAGGSENDGEQNNSLPAGSIRLRSTLLVNVRPGPGIQAMADMMEKDTEVKWGNWIGFILLPFTIGIRDDPLDYVRQAKAVVDRKKRSLEALFTFSIAEFVLKLFGTRRSNALSHRIITRTTLCFTNLVGPLEEIGYYGHPLAFLAPSSFNQPHMTVVLSVDESTIPDPHQLCDDIVHSLELIKNAVISSHGLSQS
ncbi:unnamed protein product [Linum tenue]|uniref:O-acyltransferase WSD1 C-terminal domain-containing protein n=1 Tax=Linum tenue TaxID=586396 RepID=A0AAV0RUX4_9ROSI|nr:unnamed protein product [Linum tenue]